MLLDRPGLKVFGEGEWKVRQHGYSQRRTWRKLHLAIDAATQEVVACALTENGASDGALAGPLLDAIADEIVGVTAELVSISPSLHLTGAAGSVFRVQRLTGGPGR